MIGKVEAVRSRCYRRGAVALLMLLGSLCFVQAKLGDSWESESKSASSSALSNPFQKRQLSLLQNLLGLVGPQQQIPVVAADAAGNLSTSPWQFVNSSTFPTERHECCFAAVDDKAYLIGGRGIKPVDVYDPNTDTWTSKSGPGIELNHMQCVVVDEKIYVLNAWTGPYPNETTVDFVYIYDTERNIWSTGTALPPERRRGSATAVLVKRNGNREIYVSHGNRGGHGPPSVSLNWFDKYNVDTDTWTTNLPNAPRARDHAGAALLNDNLICVAGGRNGGAQGWHNAFVKPTDCFNLDTNTWSTLPSITGAGRAGSAYGVTCDGAYMIVAGGEGGGAAWPDVTAFDGKNWTTMPFMNQPRHATQVASLCSPCDIAYVAAGAGDQGGNFELKSTEVYYPFGKDQCPDGRTAPSVYQVLVNAGGPAWNDTSGKTWQADKYYNTGIATVRRNRTIAGTTNPTLYLSERYDEATKLPDLIYDIPAPIPGTYKVDLHFCELSFSAVGQRVFDVWVEGKLIKGSLDIYKEVGKFRALIISTDVVVSDGGITVYFKPVTQNPKISALAVQFVPEDKSGPTPVIVPSRSPSAAPTRRAVPSTAWRVNAGGPQFTDSKGKLWESDTLHKYYNGGTTYGKIKAISNTIEDTLYQSERYGDTTKIPNLSYNIPVPNGRYTVNLLFAELYYAAVGKRVFSVWVEGKLLRDKFDIVAEAGAPFTAMSLSATVKVADGMLSINLNPVVQNPKISAIEVIKIG